MFKTLITFGAGIAVAVVALTALAMIGADHATYPGDVEVRVLARNLEDGRVEVAVQHRHDDNSEWSRQALPRARYLAPDSEAGHWRASNPVAIQTMPAQAEAEAAQVDPDANPATVAATTQAGDLPDLYCLVTHENPGDQEFWNQVRQNAQRWSENVPVRQRVVGSGDPAEQSALIRECLEDGAVGIGVTLANPDGVAAAISEAIAAGVVVNSFNSGHGDFRRLGIKRHVSINEVAGGREAARRLAEAGVSGTVLCVIHEAANVGLEERCDGLEQTYSGSVERFSVAETGLGDEAATEARIVERLRSANGGEPVAALLTLNARVGIIARDAIQAVDADVELATFDQTQEVLRAITDGEILFAIDTLPYHQTWFTMSSLLVQVYVQRILQELYGVQDVDPLHSTFALTISPDVFTAETAAVWFQVFRLVEQAHGHGGE